MRNKLVLWGTNAQEERVLVTMELQVDENKVHMRTYPEAVVTDEVYQQMMDKWRNGEPMDLPEPAGQWERELTMTETLLPEEIRVERSDLIQRAQTEWHYVVLSSKLSDTYRSELDELEDRIERTDRFENELWDSMKTFWDKVQNQLRDRTLLREHADELRARTNNVFSRLKEMRNKLDDEFRQRSRKNQEDFQQILKNIETRIEEGLHLNQVFNELRELQQKFRNTAFTKEHRNKVWDQLDGAFKSLKERRSGGSGGSGSSRSAAGSGGEGSPLERIERRFEGLLKAIEKMERSIQRDENDLNFENRRIANTDGQLEAQIRQAKIQMIEKRIESKQEKLAEMLKTKSQLENRLEKQREREAQLAERQRLQEAQEAAKEKIAQDMKSAQEARAEQSDKLERAAQAIAHPETTPAGEEVEPVAEAPLTEPQPAAAAPALAETVPPVPGEAPAELAQTAATPPEEAPRAEEAPQREEDSLFEAATTALGDSLVDVVDTIRAVAEVVGGRISESVEDLRERLTAPEPPANNANAAAPAPQPGDAPTAVADEEE